MLPSGIISLWHGAIVDIPAGWILCDGNNGTPDLRNKFIVGAGDSYAVGATGGASAHSHSFTSNGHSHNVTGGVGLTIGTDYSGTTSTETATGSTNSKSNLPPYYALAWIMKT